jgi:Immunity protein 8
MRAEIRHLLTPDIDPDRFVPDDAERFMFLVQVLAGPAGDHGEESFQFIVCTPGWLAEQIRRDGPMSGRHHVIVNSFDWPALVSFLQRLVSRCTGTDWDEVATRLSRFGHYEFEDYTPTPGGSAS